MALGDCTKIPYALTPAEIEQIAQANSQNTDFKNFVVYSTPPWGVVVSGGCGKILVIKDASGSLRMTDITDYHWNGQNVAETISGASYAPDAYQDPSGVFWSSLPSNVMDTINGGLQSIEHAVGPIFNL